jgi:ferredoxin/flavodoxin---NADP+ reductase
MVNLKPFINARLVERSNFSDERAKFIFEPERPVMFKPGQYVTLGVLNGDAIIQRAYSIVSSPHQPRLELFIELVKHGELTPRLWALKEGDTILMRERLVGAFVLDPAGPKKRLLIATGTGVAPFVSMARWHAEQLRNGIDSGDEFLVLQGGSRPQDLGSYCQELSALSSGGWLRYIPTISRPWEDANWTGEAGRVEDTIRKHADTHGFTADNSVAYLCGNPDMIEYAKPLLKRARFAKERIKEEKYFTTTGTTED